ncbi:hypothetical protein Tco_0550750 [Tanacetum coccineum]
MNELHIRLNTLRLTALGPRYEVIESSSAPTAIPTKGFRADYGFVGTLDDEIRRDPEREEGYGITDTWDIMVEDMQGTPAATDVAELSQRMTDFVMTIRHDMDEIYGRLDDAPDDRLLMSDQLNLLRRDRHAHARTTRLVETEARLSHEAWVQVAGSRPHPTGTACGDTNTDEDTADTSDSSSELVGPASKPAQSEIPEEAGSSS